MLTFSRVNSVFILLSLCALLLFAIYNRGIVHYSFSNLMMVNWVQQQFNIQPNQFAGFLVDNDFLLNESDSVPPHSLAAIGRIKLALGEHGNAAQILEDSVQLTSSNPILLADTLIAFSKAQKFDKVIALYESQNKPPLANQAAREAVALAYLHQQQVTGALDEAEKETVENLVPFDLYASILQFQWDSAVSETNRLPQEHLKQMANFPIEAISPTDNRLLNYTFPLIPFLREEQYWDEELLLRVLRFWVWRYPELSSLSDLIRNLSPYLDKENQNLLLSEIDSRKETNPEPAEYTFENSNLISNPSFDTLDHDQLPGWEIADYVSGRDPQTPKAAFFAGVDPYIKVDGPYSFRIDGLWKENDSGFFGAVAVSDSKEGTYYITIEPNQLYMLSGRYRTSNVGERASVYLGNRDQTFAEIWLDGSDGQWLPFDEQIACLSNQSAENMQLIVRLWTEGSVWFDDLSIRSVSDADSGDVCG